jgi:hypothetical protein
MGVAEVDGEAKPLPTALIATTAKLYAAPLVKPVTVQLVAVVVVQRLFVSSTAKAVYPVRADPPLDSEATHDTVAWALPATTVTPLGEPGTVAGVADDDVVEAGLGPTPLMATTKNV